MSTAPARPKTVPEFVDDLLRIGTKVLTAELRVDEARARDAMSAVADQLLDEYARTTLYVPAAYSQRNTELYRRYSAPGGDTPPFTAARITALAAEFQLTVRQVYSILATRRAAILAELQPELPGLEQDQPTAR